MTLAGFSRLLSARKDAMATTNPHPTNLRLVSQPKIRPILANSAFSPVVNARPIMTDSRPESVGEPTRDDLSSRTFSPAVPTLIAEAVATALQSLDVLEGHAIEVASDFRIADIAQAQRGLRNLVQSTRTLLRLAAMAAHATGTDVRALCRATESEADTQTQNALDLLTAMIVAKDWPALAGLLEMEFASALGEWRAIFEALGEFCFDPGPNAA